MPAQQSLRIPPHKSGKLFIREYFAPNGAWHVLLLSYRGLKPTATNITLRWSETHARGEPIIGSVLL